ncbi:asparagine synthase-related protein [Sporomusa malonica]|uniref:asparagine synthase (glutamine-hydrolyzing) n=1 Tax=Sporomusa malonica TaxID=112901 RepID=A0A1W2DL38_9FIRM|nr:asparagine synthase-related protein [Sporomusa malonica]SMC98210.1 asparagine synthase (glutamine-hydrolysing) [Sporomusa malonica]
MSAICGIFYCDGRPVAQETGAAMMRELGIYQADSVGTWQEGRVFFGCHAQHITPESVQEILPYHDALAGLTITADAIIDNRAELCDKLGIDSSCRKGMPDSLFILRAYQKWGQDCPKYLVGDFAFAIWDNKRQELFCAVDHTGTRTFYYYQSTGIFAFSTLVRPLFALPGIAKQRNETWIADFLAMPCVSHQLDPELTPYQNIYLLPAGNRLTVRPDRAIKQVYWQVDGQPELKMKSDSEYEEAFREVFGEAVRCRLRSIRPVGAMLSGGLDSASVASMAARELAGSDQRLLAFSAVPMLGYRDWLPAYSKADETPYIEAVRECTQNIDVTYCRFDGKHPLSDNDLFLAMLEQPYKIFENMFWVAGIMAAAKERNVGVILNGAEGNVTISWGYIQPYLLTLLRAGRWRQLYHESWATARRFKRPHKVFLQLLTELLPYEIRRYINREKVLEWCKNLQDLSPINPDFARRALVQERFHRFGYDPFCVRPVDCLEERKQRLSPDLFSHGGVLFTKKSLAYRMALRDPTADKRVIEFCLSVPDNQYVRGGRGRFLIRRAMVGILPDKVRLNEMTRGRQSADWVQRMQPSWPELADEIRGIGTRDTEKEYLDIARIQRELTKFRTLKDNAADDSNLRMLIRSLIFSRFLRQEESS